MAYSKEEAPGNGDNRGGGRSGGAIAGGSEFSPNSKKIGRLTKKNSVGGNPDVCHSANNMSGTTLPSRRALHARSKKG